MKYGQWYVGVSMLLMVACNQNNKTQNTKRIDKDTPAKVPERKRQAPAVDTDKAVATFELNTNDEVTDNDFKVQVYPTHTQDVFKVNIQYGGNTASDQLTMLPKEYYSKIALRRGSSNNECILGFVDKKGAFNKMKSITATGTHIGIKTLKAYYLSTK